MPEFDLVRRFGVRVVEVSEPLPMPVMLVDEHSLAFVSAGLTTEDRARAADWLLSACVGAAPAR